MLSTVDLDLYINKAKDWFEAKRQDEETCYANASAAVLHLAMKCIIHVKPGGRYPDFFELRRELFDKYGKHGYSTKFLSKLSFGVHSGRCYWCYEGCL